MFLALGLLLLGTLLAFNERRLGRRTLAAALAEGGGPWSLAEAVPPAVPDASNAWALLATITNQLTSPPAVRAPSLGAGYTAPGMMRSWKEPLDWTNEAGNRAGWPGLRTELEQHGPDWDVLRSALALPDCQYPLTYTNGFFEVFHDMGVSLQAGRWLSAAGSLAVHEGRTADAFAFTEDLLRLAWHQRRQTTLLGQMSRAATLTQAATLTAHLVFEGGGTDAQLRGLHDAWAPLEPLADLGSALRLERATTVDHFRILLTDGSRREEAIGWFVETPKVLGREPAPRWLQAIRSHLQIPLWRVMWHEHDLARSLSYWNRLTSAYQTAVASSWSQAAYQIYACDVATGGINVEGYEDVSPPGIADKVRCLFSTGGEKLFLPSSYIERSFRMEAMRNLSIAAIAAARFRLAKGDWPEELQELVPDFLPAVPRDPMDGETLRLRPTRQGPVIYSVGKDGENQGGNPRSDEEDSPGLAWFSGRDWVFPSIELRE